MRSSIATLLIPVASLASLVLVTSGNAHAQVIRGEVEVGGEPPPPRRRREYYVEDDRYGAFRHDGFYLRGGLGVGGLSAYPSSNGQIDQESIDGGGIAAEVMVGGTINPGIVLGAAFFFQQAFNPSYTVNQQTYQPDGNRSLNFLFLGPFIDWYPNPRRGFHVGAFGGFARLNETSPDGNSTTYSPVGGALGLMVGHDFWLAPDFSLGLSFHVAGGSVSGTPAGASNDGSVSTGFLVGQLFVSLLFN